MRPHYPTLWIGACRYDRRVLVEQGLDCREFECSVLGNDEPEASVIGEIIPSREFYDYQAKYSDDESSELRIPADIDASLAENLRAMAVTAFQAVDAAGLARVDFFLETHTGKSYVNEINTLAGLYRDQHVPETVGGDGIFLRAADRQPREPRHRTASGPATLPHRLRSRPVTGSQWPVISYNPLGMRCHARHWTSKANKLSTPTTSMPRARRRLRRRRRLPTCHQ